MISDSTFVECTNKLRKFPSVWLVKHQGRHIEFGQTKPLKDFRVAERVNPTEIARL